MIRARRESKSSQSFLAPDVAAVVGRLESFLNTQDADGRVPCNAKCGVYAFFDFDGEPIYVGQTSEQLRVRIRRHLTNQRTDSVAMHVLDPMEVAEIEVWPLWNLESELPVSRTAKLNAAEYNLYLKVLEESPIGRVLNEKGPSVTGHLDLPASIRGSIVPEELRPRLSHPDVRIARRAATIANLAAVIIERDVSLGLRDTLVTQARRLERLATARFEEVKGSLPAEVIEQETTISDDVTEI
jgi:GIY-YIG catalytic domain